MTMIITFWVTSAVLWIISVWTDVFFIFFLHSPVSGRVRRILRHRHALPVAYYHPSNRPENEIFTRVQYLHKAISNFHHFLPTYNRTPFINMHGFHESRASLCISTWVAALCTNDHVNDVNSTCRLWRCFIGAALLRHRVSILCAARSSRFVSASQRGGAT